MTASAAPVGGVHDALADRLFVAIGEGDATAVEECLGDDVVVWTNFDGNESPRPRVLKLLAWMASAIPELRYEIVRRESLADGFVQQHILRGRSPSGDEIVMPACVIATVVDGRVTRMEEYTDPTPLVTAFS
jgi:ketosteroid isomerase-like protein